jgi:hypothetical protein
VVVLETPRAAEPSEPEIEAKSETNGAHMSRRSDGASSSDAKGDSERVSTRVGGGWFGRTKTSGVVGGAAKKEL